jgi:sugar lactone lactonase YvrE
MPAETIAARREAAPVLARGFRRPEGVLALADGHLLASDLRGVTLLRPGATEPEILPHGDGTLLPNGVALLPDGVLLFANLGAAGGVWRLRRGRPAEPWLMRVDGQDLPPVNFVGLDHQGRLWISVSTRAVPRDRAFRCDAADGFIVVVDDRGARIVADGLGFANEVHADAAGRFLYLNETFAQRLSRLPIRADGSLGPRETVAEFGDATFPDGMALDAEGGVLIASIVSNRLLRVAPDGCVSVLLEDSDPADRGAVQARHEAGRLTREDFACGAARPSANLSSVAFAGPGLDRLVMGCLAGDALRTMPAPIRGAAPPHWHFAPP